MDFGYLDIYQRGQLLYYQAQDLLYPTCSVAIEEFGDISKYCVDIAVNSEIEDTLHQPTYGRGNIVVADTDNIFITDGRSNVKNLTKVFISAGYEGLNVPIWAGVVYDSKIDNNQLTLAIAQYGYILDNKSTFGDFSTYNTPFLLVNYLCNQAGLPQPIWENASGMPSTYKFGNTFQSNNRTFWAMLHGATMQILYVPVFDRYGRLVLKRRDSTSDTGLMFTDSDIYDLSFAKPAELINNKVIDYGDAPLFDFTLGDKVYFGQTMHSKTDSVSASVYGEYADYETDPFIGSWKNASEIIDQVLDYYKYPRYIYTMRMKLMPQLDLLDMIFLRSDSVGIQGLFTIIGIQHSLGSTFTTSLQILSTEEMV